MANENNLRPFNEMTKEEHKELSRKGGIASGKSKRERKTIKECLNHLLEQDTDFHFVEQGTLTGIEAICYSLYEKALQGDIRAFVTLRDSIGEKPVNKINVSEVDPKIVKEVEEMIEADSIAFTEEQKKEK